MGCDDLSPIRQRVQAVTALRSPGTHSTEGRAYSLSQIAKASAYRSRLAHGFAPERESRIPGIGRHWLHFFNGSAPAQPSALYL